MKKFALLASLSLLPLLLLAQSVKNTYPEINIPYKKYVLNNGLRLIVHEDHKAPIAAFNIWYHVGSKNEKPGKTGFAHLFEHIMFQGSEHFNNDYFKLMDSIGATTLNGTTNHDRTNYFETVPVSALDKVLWIESDRMGFLLGVIDSAKLNEQRGVVQNEKRQGENQPYSIARRLTAQSTYPEGHPYSHTVIGSMDDLDAASLNDVKKWFKTYYGPNNAVVVIAGDVNADSAFQKVKKYFGDIPPGPPIDKQTQWVAKMSGIHYQMAQDRVPQARIQKTWNVPGWATPERAWFTLLSDILTTGKTSRLYKKLVYDKQISNNVYSYIDAREIGGQFTIVCDAKPGIALTEIDSIIDSELQKIMTKGPSAEELQRAKTRYIANWVKGLQRIGGFGGKSDILAEGAIYGNDPGYYKKFLHQIENTTVADIKNTADKWLSDGEYILKIKPYGSPSPSPSSFDRSIQPAMGAAPAVKFPEVKSFTLNNRLKVSLIERHSVPVINMSLMINAGYAADQFGLPGLASLTGRMMDEGTETKTALQISDLEASLGTSIGSYSDLDDSYLSMQALSTNFKPSLELFTDILLHPSFPQKDFERVQKEQLLRIKQEQARPVTMGLRILPGLLYGGDHAYSNPLTGSGTTESVNKIARNDLIKFHNTWFSPDNAHLIVAGDITADKLKAMLENDLASWEPHDVPEKNIKKVALASSPSVYIIDKPGALQSIIFAAEISPSAKDSHNKSIEMMNRILGGDFTSRINMDLREDKHWAYGAYSIIFDALGPGLFLGYAPVQTDKTKESIIALRKEISQYVGDKPATKQEFAKVQRSAVLELPGMWETNGDVLHALQNNIKYDRGISYLNNYATMLRGLTLEDIHKAASRVVKPDHLTWVIVGDRSKIEQGIKELNIGPIKYLDAEGNVVE